MTTKTETNAFLRFAALGYSRFVPIVPPDAKIYERSTLNRQLGLDKDPRGKTPGLKNSAGEWYGFDFVHYESDETDLTRWHAMGAGVGIKTGNGLVLIDADTTNKDLAKIIVDEIKLIMPTNSVRIGQYPKAGYLVRTDPDFRYAMIGFGDANERVEILAEGKQFVAHGIHPKTLKPYFWPNGIPAYADLPFLSTADLLGLLERLAKKLPASTKISREGAATSINQSALKGGLETIRQAVKAMPNSHENFPRREDYRNVGYAIKAALQDYPHEAFEVFSDWCADWTGPDGKGNDPDTVASDWRRMQPPYRRGAQWLYEEAERLSNGRFTQAHAWFEDLSEVSLNPFDELEHKAAEEVVKLTPSYFKFPEAAKIEPRQWLYGNQYIRKFLSVTLAPSGVGKSSLAIVEALAMASGKPLLGVQPEGRSRVWMWNGEDPRDELDRRVSAAMMHYGLTREDIGDRLLVDSGRDTPIIMASEGRDGVKVATPLTARLSAVLREFRIDVLMIDPFVSSHRVPENDNGAINAVAEEWRRLADRCSCSIEIVHHVRKLHGAETHVDDSRGAGALNSASRVTRALTKMTKQEATLLGVGQSWRYFRFSDGKANLTPPADENTSWMEMRSVDLGNARVVVTADGSERHVRSDVVGVVGIADPAHLAGRVEDEDRVKVLLALDGKPWRKDVQSAQWAGVAVAEALNLDLADAADKARAKRVLAELLSDGALEKFEAPDDKRKIKEWLRLKVADKVSETTLFE